VVTSTTGVSRFLRSSGSIAVAMGVMSVATYGFTMIAARLLGPGAYGAVAALMATLLVIGVLQLGLQATAARRISAEPEHVAQIERVIMRVTIRAALALGLLMLVLTPVVNWILRLDSLPTAALVAVTAVPMTIMGGQAGILQGERRWWPLGVLYVASGVPRLVIGTALILWKPTEFSAMFGVMLGAWLPVLVGWYALRRGDRDPREDTASHRVRPILRETIHNSQALLAFFALSNTDVIVARNVLADHDAGLYAAGLIVTKAVLFLPQFVVVVAFPAMATARERRKALTRSLVVVAGLGAGCTLGSALLSDLAIKFAGGAEYADVQGRLWMFAILGTALSMLQLLVYSVLARQGQRSVYLVWATLGALVVGGLLADSVNELLTIVMLVDGLLLVTLLAVSLFLIRHPVPEDAVTPVDSSGVEA
jgi:O-antigen/teichoic acid export membrane protein